MITEVDDRFRREVAELDLRCTCDDCVAFDAEHAACAYGYPTHPHRRLPMLDETEYRFCKAFELGR
jgi:hypothetical protein